MTIHEQAFEAAMKAYVSEPIDIFKAVEKAIEAYEAALWRPIEEAPDVRPNVMVWYPTPTDPWRSWVMVHGRDCSFPDKGSMYRMIDPPKAAAPAKPEHRAQVRSAAP